MRAFQRQSFSFNITMLGSVLLVVAYSAEILPISGMSMYLDRGQRKYELQSPWKGLYSRYSIEVPREAYSRTMLGLLKLTTESWTCCLWSAWTQQILQLYWFSLYWRGGAIGQMWDVFIHRNRKWLGRREDTRGHFGLWLICQHSTHTTHTTYSVSNYLVTIGEDRNMTCTIIWWP